MKRSSLLVLALIPLVQSCRESAAQSPPRAAVAQAPSAAASPAPAPASGDLAQRFVSHPENIQPGMVPAYAGMTLRNPYEGNAQALATGEKLFVSYNCVDCHGAGGSGAMGPSLADGRWHFGGTPAEVFESIYQGRPEGMPAWGSLISPDQVWMLVTYVRSLEAGKNVTTENFTGQTVERTGH
ncbi:MAG: cytochrome c class [Gemmatimonadetes bacterium]|jgi:mono/diheme cytochrome c family protein|nr:cytochrome c class [Gemmatimonadota bacterium]